MTRTIYLLSILFICLFQVTHLQSQVYRVGGDFDYAPFSFIDKTGNACGLDIDILAAITAETGITFSYHLSEWDRALSSIQSGKTDIITGIIFSEEREAFFDFTYPIQTVDYSVFIRKDLPFNEISDLYDYQLMVLKEDISIDKFLIPMGLYKDFQVAKSIPEALAGVEWGRADYVVAPYSVGMNEIVKNKYKNIEVKGPAIMSSIYCFAVEKGNTRLLGILNKGISALRARGELTKLQAKWMVYERDDFKYRGIVKIIGITFIAALMLLAVVFIWVWLLRKQIWKTTQTINQQNQELKILNAQKDKFFSIIAHDLRSPFNAIIGFSDLLIDKIHSNDLKNIEKFAHIIKDSGDRAMHLLTNLMEWTQAQTGRLSYNPETFKINDTIDGMVLFFADIALLKSIRITRQVDGKLPVYADKEMINTVLRNLISNAIKFTSPGGSILISGEVKHNSVEISINDTGVGLSPSAIEKLFILETNDSTPGTRKEKGTGLGLILCKEFIGKNHGQIGVESEPGKGSIFFFTLPVPDHSER